MSLTEGQATPVETGTEGAPTTDTPAVSTGAEKSLTDAVLAALDEPEVSPTSTEQPGTEAAEAAASTSDTADKNDGSDSGEADKTALSEEEMSQLNAKTRTRIDDLLSQRRGLHEELRTVRAEVDQIKPAAESYGKIQKFLRDNDLAPQDAGQALSLAGLIRNNPTEAFRRLQPIYAELAKITGAALSADLAEDVRLGRITQAKALELSQARAAAQEGQQQARRRDQREQERQATETRQREVEAHQTHVASMAKVGDTLSAEMAQTDPDWKLKEPLMEDALASDIVRNGFPKDEADLRKRFKDVYGKVSKQVSSFRPAPRPMQKSPQSSSSPGMTRADPPKNVQEAVLRALE